MPEQIEIEQEIQGLVDELIERWPSAALTDESQIDPGFAPAQDAVNKRIHTRLSTVVLCAARNAAYRLMVDQGITELPKQAHLDITWSLPQEIHWAGRQAAAWTYGLGRGDVAKMFELSLQSVVKPGDTVATLTAILDLAGALRDGEAQVTFRPWDDEEIKTFASELSGEDPANEQSVEGVTPQAGYL